MKKKNTFNCKQALTFIQNCSVDTPKPSVSYILLLKTRSSQFAAATCPSFQHQVFCKNTRGSRSKGYNRSALRQGRHTLFLVKSKQRVIIDVFMPKGRLLSPLLRSKCLTAKNRNCTRYPSEHRVKNMNATLFKRLGLQK